MLQPPGNNCGLWNTSYYIRWAGLNGCKRPVARVNVLNKNPTGSQPVPRPAVRHAPHACHAHGMRPHGMAQRTCRHI
eukprot:scaffold71528_cov60-Phaeocystis_antarctica.AAC.1